jgi:Na+/melibiose symporter-like transporter
VPGTYRTALASVTRNRDLRLAQLSSFLAWTGEFLFITVTTVYAYEQDGAKGAAVISFLRVLPAALALPLIGALADRMSRRFLLLGATFVRAVTVAGAALAAAGHQTVLAYVLVTVSTVSHAAYRPTLGAMLPALCTSPEELAGSNAVRSVLDGLAGLIGPLVAAGLLAASGASAGFAAVAVISGLSLLLAGAVHYESVTMREDDDTAARRGVLVDIADGVRELMKSKPGSVVLGLGLLQCIVRGALTVFAVIVAVKMTDLGSAGVGVLWAGFGVGGLVGAFASLGAAGSSKLGSVFGAGIAVWGVPLIVCGLLTNSVVAVAAFTVVGVANALVDVSGFTLLQRVFPDHLLARVLSLAEAVFALAMAVGSLVVPAIDSAFGHSGALVATGCLLPAAVILTYPLLRNIDLHIRVSSVRIALLRRVAMLRLLPVPAIESLAGSVRMLTVPAGTEVVRKGEIGDDFYVIESGRMQVLDDGRAFAEMGPGESFGEIALLRSVPRTATVRATEDAALAVVTGQRFVAAVTGFSGTQSAAEQVVTQHLVDDARRRNR